MKIHFYQFLKIIPQNKISTYGDFAKFFGLPNHARYIGKLLNQNKHPNKYPCFKIVETSGDLGGFALGVDEKIKKLTKIGINTKNNRVENFIKYRWQPNFYNYFLAVPLDKKSQQELKNLQSNIKKIIPEEIINFQNPNTAHITINFLGKIELKQLALLIDRLKKIKFQKLSVQMEKVGFFGSIQQRKVCFISYKQGTDDLKNLNKIFKINNEQKFHPHITLFRIKNAKKFAKYEEQIKKITKKISLKFIINQLRLYTATGNVRQIPLIDFDNNEKISVAKTD